MAVEVLVQVIEKLPFKKGYMIVAKETPAVWGLREGLPSSVIVRITNATLADVEEWLGNWENKFTFEILIDNPQKYRIRMSVNSTMAATYPEGGIDQRVLDYLVNEWDAIIVNSTSEQVTFEVSKPFVLQELYDGVVDKLEVSVDPRKFLVPAAQVDAIVAAGGLIEFDLSQVQAIVVNQEG